MVNIVILLLTGSVTKAVGRRARTSRKPQGRATGPRHVDEAGAARDEGEWREGDEWHDWHESHMESRGVSFPEAPDGARRSHDPWIEAA
jgi:hypothetical protein